MNQEKISSKTIFVGFLLVIFALLFGLFAYFAIAPTLSRICSDTRNVLLSASDFLPNNAKANITR